MCAMAYWPVIGNEAVRETNRGAAVGQLVNAQSAVPAGAAEHENLQSL
jgi:hypothetical protein